MLRKMIDLHFLFIECSEKNGLMVKLLHDKEISLFVDVKDDYSTKPKVVFCNDLFALDYLKLLIISLLLFPCQIEKYL